MSPRAAAPPLAGVLISPLNLTFGDAGEALAHRDRAGGAASSPRVSATPALAGVRISRPLKIMFGDAGEALALLDRALAAARDAPP